MKGKMTNGQTLPIPLLIRSQINVAHMHKFSSNKLAKIRKITHIESKCTLRYIKNT